jgi:hypothetical protein
MLGAALTAASGARPVVLGLLRTFAATAAAGVVLTHLLPDALAGAHLWGGLAFLVGLLGPLLLHPLTERLALRRTDLSPRRLALEAGFFGLLVHHVGDGLGIGAYAALPGGVLAHLDVILALIAHTVPLVAVVTLAYRGEYGLAVALRRVSLLAATSALGVMISFAVPSAALTSASAWIGALVSGVLLHVVTHDWLEDLPKSEGARLLDLLAAALGLSLVFLGGHGDEGPQLLASAVTIAERGSPFLLVALALSFTLGDGARKELGNLGKSLPVTLATRLGFALGAEGLALGLATYGVAWTLAAALATTVVPIVAATVAVLAIAIAGEDAAKATAERLAARPPEVVDRLLRFDRATAIWIASVAVAAAISGSLNDGALYGSLGGPAELTVASGFGLLLRTGGPSVVALSALTEKGLSPGAALLAATLSSALGAKTLVELRRLLGWRGVIPVLIWLVSLTGALAIGLNQAAPIARPLTLPSSFGRVAALVVLALIVVRAERVGLRRWLAGWFAASPHGHHHAHHEHHEHHHAELVAEESTKVRS